CRGMARGGGAGRRARGRRREWAADERAGQPGMTAGALGPVHHPTADFFVCDIFAAAPKDDMGSMEHPMFSLATRPDRRILRYAHNGIRIEVVPSVKGLATIHDKDVLIYCISQLMAALNAGLPVSR